MTNKKRCYPSQYPIYTLKQDKLLYEALLSICVQNLWHSAPSSCSGAAL